MISVSDAQNRLFQIIADIQELVEIESPSSHKPSVDAVARVLAGKLEGQGARTEILKSQEFGNHLRADFPGTTDAKPLLLLGHIDTVWELGTLASMPFRNADGRLWGPGVLDMKAGIVIAQHALALLRDNDVRHPQVRMLLVSDEEVGSHSSRAITEQLARESQAVLVLEPGQGLEGAVKTARKGVGVYELKVSGVAAHAGVDPGKGANAIHELARQVEAIAKFNDLERGLTANVGVVRGGTRSNVISAEAWAEVDVRVKTTGDGEWIDTAMHGLRVHDERCKLQVSGGINRPPMERTEKVVALYRKAEQVARNLGVPISEQATGGGSDGNFTAALGVPTLDGLGAVGEGAHAVNESILIEWIAPRTALLAGLIATLA